MRATSLPRIATLLAALATTARGLRLPPSAVNGPAIGRRGALGLGAAAATSGSLLPALLPSAAASAADGVSASAGAIGAASVCDPAVSLVRTASGAEITLVGTAHISEESAELVRQVIRTVRPDVVMLELDPSRARGLMQRRSPAATTATPSDATALASPSPSSPPPPPRTPSFGMGQLAGRLIRGDLEGAGAQAVGVGLSSLYKQLDSMGFQSGAEFVAAVEEADALHASILLGDRDARETVKRLRDALAEVISDPAFASGQAAPPASLAVGGGASGSGGSGGGEFTRESVLSTMAVLKQRENVRELTSYLRTSVPPLYEALIAERDDYMARSLLRSDGRRIVAVVGLAHVDGIEARIASDGKRLAKPRPLCAAA